MDWRSSTRRYSQIWLQVRRRKFNFLETRLLCLCHLRTYGLNMAISNFFSFKIWPHFWPKNPYGQRGSPFFFVAKWKKFGTKKCPITHRSLFTHGSLLTTKCTYHLYSNPKPFFDSGLPRYLLLGTICQHSHRVSFPLV